MRAAAVLGLAGGFAYGVAQAGDELVGVWENGFGRPLVEANLPGVPYLDESRSNPPSGLDLVVGCPPCAGWSSASAGLDQRFNPAHPINDGIRRWFEAVEVAQPVMACLECVQGLAMNGRELWGPLARRLEELGYSWKIVLYDNQQMGVPQRRRRMLLWVFRGHGDLEFESWGDARWEVPVGPALDVPLPHEREWWEPPNHERAVHRLFPYVPEGSNVRRVPYDVYWREYHEYGVREGWPSFTYRRLAYDRPAPAMMGNALAAIIHYDHAGEPNEEVEYNMGARLITGRELARIMGYTDDFSLWWEGANGSPAQRGQLSKWLCQAVSPAVGRWAAQTASIYLEQPGDDRQVPGRIVALG